MHFSFIYFRKWSYFSSSSSGSYCIISGNINSLIFLTHLLIFWWYFWTNVKLLEIHCSKYRIKQLFNGLLSYKEPNAVTLATDRDLLKSLLEKEIFSLSVPHSPKQLALSSCMLDWNLILKSAKKDNYCFVKFVQGKILPQLYSFSPISRGAPQAWSCSCCCFIHSSMLPLKWYTILLFFPLILKCFTSEMQMSL